VESLGVFLCHTSFILLDDQLSLTKLLLRPFTLAHFNKKCKMHISLLDLKRYYMIIVLFGLSASGKNFVGETLAQCFSFHFWDADEILTPEMLASIKEKKPFTQEMRNHFIDKVIHTVSLLKTKHENIVVAQALYREQNRRQILKAHPEAKLVWIRASSRNITSRLKQRDNEIDEVYANKIMSLFEKPEVVHGIIDNDTDRGYVIKQLEALLETFQSANHAYVARRSKL
jgi:gluconate kinase